MMEPPFKDKYEWDAKDYARHSCHQQQWARELIEKIQLSGHECVLDIGCGDGKVTAEIAKHIQKGRVVGIDNSDEMIALAHKSFPASNHPNLVFMQMDASALSFREEFDIVFSNAALHWIINHKPLLKGIYQSLKPNGKVIVQMGGKGNAAGIIEVLDKLISDNPWHEYFQNFSFPYGFYSPEEYEPWLKEAGFKIQHLELKPKTMVYENIDGIKGWIRTTWLPYLNRLPKDLRDPFIDSIIGKYIEKYGSTSGDKIKIEMQRLEFVAIK